MFARKPEEVRNVRLTIIEEDVLVNDLMRSPNYNENQVDYFGWIQFKEDGTLYILRKCLMSAFFANGGLAMM